MNNSYYETLDENFTQALKFYEEDYTHRELIEMLKCGNLIQKQIAALRLENIESVEDARVLISNLTGQDGKVREAVSLKLDEFMSNPQLIEYFKSDSIYDVFKDAIIDINANICRNVIHAISNLKSDDEFCTKFCSELAEKTLNLLNIIEKLDFRDGKYKVNKEVFKLYWCMETIYEFEDKIEFPKLKEIILRAKDIKDYTIREKAAKILTKGYNDQDLQLARKDLKNDPNYYVRRLSSL